MAPGVTVPERWFGQAMDNIGLQEPLSSYAATLIQVPMVPFLPNPKTWLPSPHRAARQDRAGA